MAAMVERIEDRELLHLIAQQDKYALETLYDRYEKSVYQFAFRFVRSADKAEEIVQDVFFKVWKAAPTYDASSAKVLTWILAICRNQAIDRLRKSKRDAEIIEPEKLQLIADQHTNVEHDAETRMMSSTIQHALQELPQEQRDIIEWMYYQGLSQSEIAEEKDLSLGTVKSRVRLAMTKLRNKIGDLGKEESKWS